MWGVGSMLRRIVLATDGSPSALAAARYVTTMGLDPADIELDVIYVLAKPRTYAASHATAGTLPTRGAQASQATQAGDGAGGGPDHEGAGGQVATLAPTPSASAAVDATLATLGSLRARARVQFASGVPAQEIVDFARRTHADLIVVGKRGQSPTEDLLLGSVCAQVLHTAPCAVLVVGGAGNV